MDDARLAEHVRTVLRRGRDARAVLGNPMIDEFFAKRLIARFDELVVQDPVMKALVDLHQELTAAAGAATTATQRQQQQQAREKAKEVSP